MKKLIPTIAVLAMAPALWAVQGTISSDSDSKKGEITWMPRNKIYTVEYKKGSTTVTAEFALADVTKLDIPKPGNLDKLIQQVADGKGAGAIEPLKKIVADYKMLVWDKPAARALVEAYLSTGKGKDAYDTAEKLVSEEKSLAYSGDLAPAYWRALLQVGKNERLEQCLNKAATSGDRASSAEALVMRGEITLAKGNSSPDSCRQALVDNFLRVALMYTDPPCTSARKQALLKAAECFEKIGMAQRADTVRTQAKEL